MALSNCIVLTFSTWISLNAVCVEGENKTNNQNDSWIASNAVSVEGENKTNNQNDSLIASNAVSVIAENKTNNQNDSGDYQLELNDYESKVLKDAFVKEFNSIMSSKNAQIQSLKKELKLVDKLINSSNNQKESSSVEENASISVSQTTKETESNFTLKNCKNLELKGFVKRRLRSAFEKEFKEIIKEKSCQIYLLEELLAEKRKSLAMQRRLQEKRNKNGTEKQVTYGVGEPSASEY